MSILSFLTLGSFGRKDTPPEVKKYATFNQRMLAATIDSVIAMVTLAPVLDYILGTYFPLPQVDWTAVHSQIPAGASNQEANRIIVKAMIDSGYMARWLDNFFWQCVALSAATGVCWHFWSATPGKILLRLKIVDAKTEAPISTLQILMRLMGYVVSTFSFCLGFFWIGFDKRRQGWHDKLADTVVIKIPKVKSASAAADPSDSPVP